MSHQVRRNYPATPSSKASAIQDGKDKVILKYTIYLPRVFDATETELRRAILDIVPSANVLSSIVKEETPSPYRDDNNRKYLDSGPSISVIVNITVPWNYLLYSISSPERFAFITLNQAAHVDTLLEHGYILVRDKELLVRPRFAAKNSTTFKSDKELLDAENAAPLNRLLMIVVEREKKSSILKLGESDVFNITVANDGARLDIVATKFIGKHDCFSLDFKHPKGRQRKARVNGVITLDQGDKYTLRVKFEQLPNQFRPGRFSASLQFKFSDKSVKMELLSVVVADPNEFEMLKPSSTFKPPSREITTRTVIPAFPPDRDTSRMRLVHTSTEPEWATGIPQYFPPDNLVADVDIRGTYQNFNPWKTRDQYRQRMHDLLWMEEAHQKKLIRIYDRYNVPITVVTEIDTGDRVIYFSDSETSRVKIPNLAEKRPSVQVGDIITAWIPGERCEYEGYVNRLEKDSLLVYFCKDFHMRHSPGQLFNVKFSFNRVDMRVMHKAVDTVNLDVIHPQNFTSKFEQIIDMTTMQLKDKKLKDNREQLVAIQNIVNKSPNERNVPYLIFGPFGTGKTKCLVESVRQVLTHRRESKILICAPANSAVDALLEQLVDTSVSMFRLYAQRRGIHTIPAHLQKFTSYDNEKEQFTIPSLERLKQHSIIFTTCAYSFTLFGQGIPNTFFTHIFIDEAAQVMEAEVLIPLCLANPKTVIVLAGDDKQLGSTVHSVASKHHGLTTSLMERLMNTQAFVQEQDRTHVRLINNYRSHEAIVKITSKLFYNDRLIACANKEYVNSLSSWSQLPKPGFPIYFHGVEGQDEREGESPSFFNRHEIIAIANLVGDLYSSQQIGLDEIGVIAPYYLQVQKIRQLLKMRGLREVKVGSVAEFQGKQYRALFLSTVRASRHWMEHDQTFGLGLIHNPRAMNTALSRVSSLLVVVGDPYTLNTDKDWSEFLTYCQANNAYFGPERTQKYMQDRERQDIPPSYLDEPASPRTSTSELKSTPSSDVKGKALTPPPVSNTSATSSTSSPPLSFASVAGGSSSVNNKVPSAKPQNKEDLLVEQPPTVREASVNNIPSYSAAVTATSTAVSTAATPSTIPSPSVSIPTSVPAPIGSKSTQKTPNTGNDYHHYPHFVDPTDDSIYPLNSRSIPENSDSLPPGFENMGGVSSAINPPSRSFSYDPNVWSNDRSYNFYPPLNNGSMFDGSFYQNSFWNDNGEADSLNWDSSRLDEYNRPRVEPSQDAGNHMYPDMMVNIPEPVQTSTHRDLGWIPVGRLYGDVPLFSMRTSNSGEIPPPYYTRRVSQGLEVVISTFGLIAEPTFYGSSVSIELQPESFLSQTQHYLPSRNTSFQLWFASQTAWTSPLQVKKSHEKLTISVVYPING